MAVSYRGFQIELYEEYLSDGAFVSDQRRQLLANPLGKWGLLRDWEDRTEAYIDGLSVGADLALEVCTRRAIDGEPGEFEIAVRTFCRASRFDLIERIVNEAGEGPKVTALAEGLLHERHTSLPVVIERLVNASPKLLPSLAKVIGYQRLPLASLLIDAKESSPSVAWALGRLRDGSSGTLLRSLLRDGGAPEAALALARTSNTLDSVEQWPLFLRGLMGEAGRLGELHSDPSPDSSLALGLLGFAESVPYLMARLPQPESALALQLITGAGLTVEQPVADEELEPDERATLETQLNTDSAHWLEWWNAHGDRLPRTPLRSGQPYSETALLRHLENPEGMHVERYWAAEQLACRHGRSLAFEPDMLVVEQRSAL
jgi:hypothetical protein